MKVEGKAAVITGGGTGVGRATGLALGKLGCAVLVNYSRSNKEAEETAKDIEALGVKAIPFKADVADDAKCRAMIDKAVKEFGRLDILVNNAGTTSFIPHPDLDAVKDEDWDRIMAVNVKGTFQCARAARGPLEEAGEGEIINITSVAGLAGTGSSIPYCA
ncbi:MAG: SDR family NAD(P)-dependent oxidoreductase, partial [Candidatus Adiutricales bacterium]